MKRSICLSLCLLALVGGILCASIGSASAQTAAPPRSAATTEPSKIYVPYEELKKVFQADRQGVFLPYGDFERLWNAARAAPAGVDGAPLPYLVSTARFSGQVGQEVATLTLELTVDVLAEGWQEIPLGLGDVAVSEASFVGEAAGAAKPLLRVVDGRYVLLTREKGRRTLRVSFVDQLQTAGGLNVLSFRIPRAAITTLELMIPEENMKVDVEPMLAATTSQDKAAGKPITRLQAFLGSADAVKLSWKPKTQAAGELEPVVVEEQSQHISVGEAVIGYDVTINYDIRRRGIDALTVQLPAGFRVTAVDGPNIANWDVAGAGERPTSQPATRPAAAAATSPAGDAPAVLEVKLFAPAKDSYRLAVRMERFVQDSTATVALTPVVTRQAVRRSGVVGITHSPRRSVQVQDAKNIARVDTGKLPEAIRNQPGALAYQFSSSDYSMALAVDVVAPRITAVHNWALAVQSDRLELRGQLNYTIERSGVFQVKLAVPQGWEVATVGPANVVDDHQLPPSRELTMLLKAETTGPMSINITLTAPRAGAESPVELNLPTPLGELQLYSGQLVVWLADELRGEAAAVRQLSPMPLGEASTWTSFSGRIARTMAYSFRQADRSKPLGLSLTTAAKPAQVSARVYRLVNIQPGWIDDEALVQYHVQYAPVDTFYVRVPAEWAQRVQITGANIKEKPQVSAAAAAAATQAADNAAPASRQAPGATAPASQDGSESAYFKIILQSPIVGQYQLRVAMRRSFTAPAPGQVSTVDVPPVLAAGKLADQSGAVSIAKADTLALGEPTIRTNLEPADASSASDVPVESHRKAAAIAFKYNAPPFALAMPVQTQREAQVLTTLCDGMLVEQSLSRDGRLSSRAVFALQTSTGGRLVVSLPDGAEAFSFSRNGQEAPVEQGASPPQRIISLPPSAGQVARHVVEVRYGQSGASSSSLGAPLLADTAGHELPVQQVLWRLAAPAEDYLLHYDRTFQPIEPSSAAQLLAGLSSQYPTPIRMELPDATSSRGGGGTNLHLIAQGPRPPTRLSVLLAGKEAFSIIVWAVILIGGAAMLWLPWFRRVLIVLAAVLVLAVVRLWAPLLVSQIVQSGRLAAVLVVLLWLAALLLRGTWRLVRNRPSPPPGPGPSPAPATQPQNPNPQAPGGKE